MIVRVVYRGNFIFGTFGGSGLVTFTIGFVGACYLFWARLFYLLGFRYGLRGGNWVLDNQICARF